MAGSVPYGQRRMARIAAVLTLTAGAAGLLSAPASGASRPAAREPARAQQRSAAQQQGVFPARVRRDLPGLTAAPARPRLLAQPAPALGRSRPGLGPGPQPAAPAPANSPWQLQPAANALSTNGFLYSISCPTAAACTAVGSYENAAATEVPLAQASTGAAWHPEAAATPPGAEYTKLYGVSCTAVDSCAAAGYYLDSTGEGHPLAEQWNGTAWSIEATPAPAGSVNSGLFAISCPAANACTAVGATKDSAGTETPVAEQWNGTAWQVQAVPVPAGSTFSEFLAVSCSSALACTAGGTSSNSSFQTSALAERWNGTGWQIQPTPSITGSSGAEFDGVSCAASQSCIAAGTSFTQAGDEVMLAEAWNGTTWSVQAAKPPRAADSDLLAVSCSAPDACFAVGSYGLINGTGGVLADYWDGSSWQLHFPPKPAGSPAAEYDAVSCTAAATACTAAGAALTASSRTLGLAAAWQGTDWQTQPTPEPTGAAARTSLDGVSCVSASDCIAAGFFVSNNDMGVPLAERWDGASWQIQPTPNPATLSSGQFYAVSCASASACTGVGYYLNSSGQTVTLAERWNGTDWQIQPTPNPAAAVDGSYLNAVSCATPDACAAVGYYFTSTRTVPFAETWNGTAWSAESTPVPQHGRTGYLDGVSCTSPGDCVAVGYFDAETWNGTRWRFEHIAVPASAATVLLSSVSCSAASTCTAVGTYSIRFQGSQNLAESWTGSRWAVETAPDHANAKVNGLNSVSCTAANACTAVGVWAHGEASPSVAGAQTWNGTDWTLGTVPTPPGAAQTALFGVSCLVSGCTGTGASVAGLSSVQEALAMHTAGAGGALRS
jgi:hypothetical protein